MFPDIRRFTNKNYYYYCKVITQKKKRKLHDGVEAFGFSGVYCDPGADSVLK